MTHGIQAALNRIINDHDLSASEMHSAIAEMMEGRASEIRIAALLTALKMKGESVDEIAGAARAMHERATPIKPLARGLLDTCGTGGDELFTFNISTATALVAAAAGVPVAKHGNRSVSSSSGSADVLEALGVNVSLAPEMVSRSIDELGIGFCFAPLIHGAMKYAAPVRKELGFRTIFNLLGPLTNPADAEYQLIGTNRNSTAEKLAHALAQLGRKRALVVCGADELDEVSLWGETAVFEVVGEKVSRVTWNSRTFGLPECRVEDLRVNSAQESAEIIQGIFAGNQGPARDMVLANTATALMAAERSDDPLKAVQIAQETVDSGKAGELCRRLAETTNR